MKFPAFFERATGRSPYAYQTAFATAPLLADILEAPTGSGKTATAALGWLWRRRHGTPAQQAEAGARLVFCLPMRTLVEQTDRVVRGWRASLGLENALSVHLLLGGKVDDEWEGHPDGDAILIGTQDQLLSRALLRGYAMSRFLWPVHFALLNNDCTWVMDEVQLMGVGSSTASQLQAFREQQKTAGSAKTVWMTATLAEGRLRTVDVDRPYIRQPFEAVEEPLLRRLNARKLLVRAGASVGKKGSLGPLAKEIALQHEPGTLTLVVVNRVARAQELLGLIAADSTVEATALVHSRFRPADRRRIQDAALNGSFKGVLVATQAVEAGVDLSAKTLFSELAPWSSMVQRFGRLNRAGEHSESRAFWIDLDNSDAEQCLPYEAAALDSARLRLKDLENVGPASLAGLKQEDEQPILPVLRKKDLLELFDTEPDLAGHDIDVSRFIRATDDRDVQVAWRELRNQPPGADAPDLHRDELCSVPLHALEKMVGAHKVWRFDGLRKRWTELTFRPAGFGAAGLKDRAIPGMSMLMDVSVGGYAAELGFTGNKSHLPASLEKPGDATDYDESDALVFGSSDFVTLLTHAQDTAEEMQQLLDRLNGVLSEVAGRGELVEAARWHDTGKAHAAFQQMLIAALPPDDPRRTAGPWAKSDRRGGRNPRQFFRHELASALAWLAAGKGDIGAFVVAAHHGKVRLSLRARPGEEPPPGAAPGARFAHGVCDGDDLPLVDLGDGATVQAQKLSLACMSLGGDDAGYSWTDRMLRLLAELGPFRLAYLETLVRVADWRASAKRRGKEEVR